LREVQAVEQGDRHARRVEYCILGRCGPGGAP
jgi:hypothetical protein